MAFNPHPSSSKQPSGLSAASIANAKRSEEARKHQDELAEASKLRKVAENAKDVAEKEAQRLRDEAERAAKEAERLRAEADRLAKETAEKGKLIEDANAREKEAQRAAQEEVEKAKQAAAKAENDAKAAREAKEMAEKKAIEAQEEVEKAKQAASKAENDAKAAREAKEMAEKKAIETEEKSAQDLMQYVKQLDELKASNMPKSSVATVSSSCKVTVHWSKDANYSLEGANVATVGDVQQLIFKKHQVEGCGVYWGGHIYRTPSIPIPVASVQAVDLEGNPSISDYRRTLYSHCLKIVQGRNQNIIVPPYHEWQYFEEKLTEQPYLREAYLKHLKDWKGADYVAFCCDMKDALSLTK